MNANGENRTESEGEGELSRRQRRAIPHLVLASTIEAGCKSAKISRTTLMVWKRHPAFMAALRAAEEAASREALANLQRLMVKASDTLAGLLDSKEEWLRHRASVDIIVHGMKAREHLELEERLAKLEKWQEEKIGTNRPRAVGSA